MKMTRLIAALLLSGCSMTIHQPATDAGFVADDGGAMCAVIADGATDSHEACAAFGLAAEQPRGEESSPEVCAGRVCPWADSGPSPMATPCPTECNAATFQNCIARLLVSNDCRNFDLVLASAECREAC